MADTDPVKEDIGIYCGTCGSGPMATLRIQPVEGSYPMSDVRTASIVTTAVWAATHVFRCGSCFIKKTKAQR